MLYKRFFPLGTRFVLALDPHLCPVSQKCCITNPSFIRVTNSYVVYWIINLFDFARICVHKGNVTSAPKSTVINYF